LDNDGSATRILVVDDDAVACEFLQEALQISGYDVDYFTSAKETLRNGLAGYDLLLSDIRMPEMDGLEFLRQARKARPGLPVILMTAFGSLETTMEALQEGAWDYISKPFSPEDIREMVRKVLDVRKLRQLRRQEVENTQKEPQFIGSSAAMVDFYKQIARVADSSASILISGESGTGKELTAHSLHQLSARREKPFLAVNCGAIPETLLESELFGFEKGAFTGADHAHQGLLEAAQGGTVFLDEITEMSPALQGKLLRFMQSGEVRRLGGHDTKHVAARVVAAANRDIEKEADAGRFRSDLLFRFVVHLRTPPLRAHREDIPQLIDSLLKKWGYANVRISDEALGLLMAYKWPGNVRELENVLRQTLLLSPFALLTPENLPEKLHPPSPVSEQPLLSLLERAERQQIHDILESTSWNQSRAAQLLRIDRKTLHAKIIRYHLTGR
jgi:DNA-binding NtrC family response regulator